VGIAPWEGVPRDARTSGGHYAHYEVVACQALTTSKPTRAFEVSYGFTEFRIEDDR